MKILVFFITVAISVLTVCIGVCLFDLIIYHFKSKKEELVNYNNSVLNDWIDRLFQNGIAEVEEGEFYDCIKTANYSAKFWNGSSDFFYASEGTIMDSKGDIILSWHNTFPSKKYSMKMKKYVNDYAKLVQKNN